MFLNSVSLIFFLLSFMQRSLEGAHVDKPITSNTTNTMTGFHVSGTAFTCKLELSHLSSNVINFIFHTWRKENLNFCRKPRGIYIFAANRKKAIRIYSVRATRWPNIAGGLRMLIHYCDLLEGRVLKFAAFEFNVYVCRMMTQMSWMKSSKNWRIPRWKAGGSRLWRRFLRLKPTWKTPKSLWRKPNNRWEQILRLHLALSLTVLWKSTRFVLASSC